MSEACGKSDAGPRHYRRHARAQGIALPERTLAAEKTGAGIRSRAVRNRRPAR